MTEIENKVQRYESYKESEVEWLGEIPEHWEVLPLFALTKLKSITNNNGLELLSVYLDKGVIRFSDVTAKRTNVTSLDLSKYQLVEPGDFVLNNQQAWRGSVGVSNYNGIVSPAYIVLSLRSNLNPTFANYLFRDGSMVSQYLINSKGVGTIQRNLYWPSLRRSSISLPPLPEQTKIAQFLDDKTSKIEGAIAIKEQQINLLKERKQILIHKAVTRGLDDSVALKDSGVEWIGEIPEHWEVKRLGVISQVIDPQPDHRAPKMDENGLPYLGIRDINKDGTINICTARMVEVKAIEKQERSFTLNDGDILYGKVGTLGNPKRIKLGGERVALSATLVIIKTPTEIMSRYLKFALDSNLLYSQIEKIITGATRPALGIQQIRKFKVVIPNENELEKVVRELETASQKIETAIDLKQREIEKLKEYKSSLINGVVTGKVRVC